MNAKPPPLAALCGLLLALAGCEPSGPETRVSGLRGDTPHVQQVVRDFGSTFGDEQVSLLGSGFAADTRVKFGSQDARAVQVVNWEHVIAVTPPSLVSGPVDVTVTNRAGSTVAPGAYTYVDVNAPPIISTVSPTNGSLLGRTPITVRGAGFLADTAMTVGGRPVTDLVVKSLVEVQARTPASATPGPADVVVRTARGSATAAGGFTYTQPPSVVVTGLAPTAGSINGGTLVTITGAGFVDGTSVTFGANAGTVLGTTGTTLTVVTPAGAAAGAVDVQVANGTLSQTTRPGAFTYVADALTPIVITSFTPTTATVTANLTSLSVTTNPDTCIITGTGFAPGASVFFGTAAAVVKDLTPTQIVSSIPAPPLPSDPVALLAALNSIIDGTWTADPVPITVTNLGGQTGASDGTFLWTVDSGQQNPGGSGGENPAAAPTIISVTPNELTLDLATLSGTAGTALSGLNVIIAGTNFDTTAGETTVKFGAQTATIVAVTGNLITVNPPLPANAQTLLSQDLVVDVSVTTAAFPNDPAVKTNAFTYKQISLTGGTGLPTGGTGLPTGGTGLPTGGTGLPSIPGITGP